MAIRVKFLAKGARNGSLPYWSRYLPKGSPVIGNCEFDFEPGGTNYDWLVVYDDFPSSSGERFGRWRETLSCHPRNTLFITAEPSTIKVYGKAFLNQFGHVLTSQEPWALDHPNVIRSQCGLLWFYGKSYSEAAKEFPSKKPRLISTVCSSKKQRHTLHALRHRFTMELAKHLPELEVFGHGHRFVETKAEVLDPHRYHLAIENHLAPHHWTEKLADAFLGGCLPIYFGCPNVFNYFPEESLVLIDIRNTETAIHQIQEILRLNLYEKRLSAIQEARRLVLEEYSLFPLLARLILKLHHTQQAPLSNRETILSRHAWRRAHPLAAVGDGISRFMIKARSTSTTIKTPLTVSRI